jgi:hypothetical protein
MSEIDIERRVYCPNPDFGGSQDVDDCISCEFYGEITRTGTTLICNYPAGAP